MRSTNLRNGMRFLALVALLSAIGHRTSVASGIIANIEYSTTGTIGTEGMTGSPVISFQGVDDGALTTGGTPFKLGDFFVSQPEGGSTTTYDFTPFNMTLTVKAINGVALDSPKSVPILIELIGRVTGNGNTSVAYSPDRFPYIPEAPPLFPTYIPPFKTNGLTNYFRVDDEYGANNQLKFGLTTLTGVINSAEVVPEPSSTAFYICIVGTFVARRIRQSTRLRPYK